MAQVAEIERKGFIVEIRRNECKIICTPIHTHAETKIQAVFKAVQEFDNWFNI